VPASYPPRREKVTFTGQQGHELAGLLEQPATEPKHIALLAHCFTCNKDIVAASRIAKALVEKGYGVLRFDFTGLGNSDGDFANTNFSSNVGDLIAAADFLRNHIKAPELLIGHSLGGTAVLAAAHAITEAKGVVTIGSPADPAHVAKQFQCNIDDIQANGKATVNLAGRDFTIKKQFLDDLQQASKREHIKQLKQALLVFHSPTDTTVLVQEAEKIYTAAKHPKSFVSLDKADHLLTNKDDAIYVSEIISSWATRYLH